jgi:hypothetical protein
MSKVKKWQELGLQRGDVLLCAGRSKMSRAIQKFQKYTGAKGVARTISHVAEVHSTMPLVRDYTWNVYESTAGNKWAGKSGVQLNPFQQWLDNYNGAVYAQKWKFDRTIDYFQKDDVFVHFHADDKYESGIPGAIELALCGLRLHRYIQWAFPSYTPAFTSEPHCTELIGMKKVRHGHLPDETVINRLPPWIWWEYIRELATVPVSEPILIKE